jgi:hypothetical protein
MPLPSAIKPIVRTIAGLRVAIRTNDDTAERSGYKSDAEGRCGGKIADERIIGRIEGLTDDADVDRVTPKSKNSKPLPKTVANMPLAPNALVGRAAASSACMSINLPQPEHRHRRASVEALPPETEPPANN